MTERPREDRMSRNHPRMSRKKLLLLLLLGSVLLLVTGSAGLTWLTLRVHRPPRPPDSGKEISWQTRLGSHRASDQLATRVTMPPAIATYVFREVLSVEDAVEWDEGWVLLDSRGGQLHLLRFGTGRLESLGREGEGPGELKDPVALALQDSLLWVLNERGFSLDLFHLPSRFVERTRLEGGGCFAGLAKGLVALGSGRLYLLRICPAVLPGPGTAWVEAINADGTLLPLVSMTLGEAGSRRLHLGRQPIATGVGGTLFLGTGDAPCLQEIEEDGTLREVRCLPEYNRPATPPEEVTGLEARLKGISRLGLLPIHVPEFLPWYDRAFTTSQGPVLRRLQGPTDRDLVLLGSDGRDWVAVKTLPALTFVGEETVLAATELLQGTRIQIYPNPWH